MKEIIKKSKGVPRRRLQHIYDLARTKSVCEGGENGDKTQNGMGEDTEDFKQMVIGCGQIKY